MKIWAVDPYHICQLHVFAHLKVAFRSSDAKGLSLVVSDNQNNKFLFAEILNMRPVKPRVEGGVYERFK